MEDRIVKYLEQNGILTTSEVAELTGIKFNEVENTLIDMEDLGTVFAVGSNSWQIND